MATRNPLIPPYGVPVVEVQRLRGSYRSISRSRSRTSEDWPSRVPEPYPGPRRQGKTIPVCRRYVR